jgi:hemerythrin-like metal-binding protein
MCGLVRASAPGERRPRQEDVMATNWYDFQATGFATIDLEHEEISGSLTGLLDAINSGHVMEITTPLTALVKQVADHFAHEERLMVESGYPLAKRHKEAHDMFVLDAGQSVLELKERGLTDKFRRWATGRLLEWFRLHIATNDVGLGRYLAARAPSTAVQAPAAQPAPAPATE